MDESDKKPEGFWDRASNLYQQARESLSPDTINANTYLYLKNQKGLDDTTADRLANQTAQSYGNRAGLTGGIAQTAASMASAPVGVGMTAYDMYKAAREGDAADVAAAGIGAAAPLAARPIAQGVQKGYKAVKGAFGYADGGDVSRALSAIPQAPEADPVSMAKSVMAQPRASLTPGQQKLMATFQSENRPAAVVSPKPGTGSTENTPGWSFTTPDEEGADRPPPIQAPVRDTPRLSNIAAHAQKTFKTKGFQDLARDVTGLHTFEVTPTTGSWLGKVEPSFIIRGKGPNGEEATPEQIRKLSHLLGFGWQQDAVVEHHHNPSHEEGDPTLYLGKGSKLSQADLDKIHGVSQDHKLDFTRTGDGMGVKFTHFVDKDDTPEDAQKKYEAFLDKVESIANKTGLPDRLHVRTKGDLKYAKGYLDEIFGGAGGEEGLPPGTARSPDLFRRTVDHLLAPYAKAVASEGYRLSPDRLGEFYGLTPEEVEYTRNALLPKKSVDRSTVPLMTGDETLDVRPTGQRGENTVDDVLYALQNRAAQRGQIDPTDRRDETKNLIAKTMADEVEHHANTSEKSAIGWYDSALKRAKDRYSEVFPEIKQDPHKEMLFDAILGITSQGNDVHANSIFASRLYNLVRDEKMSLSEATDKLKGTFGEQTRAIEYNLKKLDHLLDTNGFERMKDVFNQKKTVSEWRKILKNDKSLYGFDGKPLDVEGKANQKVTGWMVFGPKIGSFINNLHGDYSTLTADLWFSRTYNRMLGHNFLHTPLQEAKQYRRFAEALAAEYGTNNREQRLNINPQRTTDGKLDFKDGKPVMWQHGDDTKGMNREDFDAHFEDPEKMLQTAREVYDKYVKSGYKGKSDLRRRAKNWIENRYDPVAAPRGDEERGFQQEVAENAQKMLKKKGIDISIADIQAALWFHEKELFQKHGVATSRSAPADYADAAERAVALHKAGRLYDNWSDIQNEIKAEARAKRQAEKEQVKAEKLAQREAEKAAKMQPQQNEEPKFARGGTAGLEEFGDATGNEPTARTYPEDHAQTGELQHTGGLGGGSGVLPAPDQGSAPSPLEGLPTRVKIPQTGKYVEAGPSEKIRQTAEQYMQDAGLPYNPPTSYKKVDPELAGRIAQAFDDMKHEPDHPLVKASYIQMAKEAKAQYDAAVKAGAKFEFWNPETEEDPYGASPRLAIEDLHKNNHMFVFPTMAGFGQEPISEQEMRENPMLADSGERWNGQVVTYNDLFRAVHDYFGHAKEGVGFRADGEENAWRAHASMFSPLARLAMTTETRGQNSWLNHGPHGEKNRTARVEDTIFADQKVGLLPHWAHHEGAEDFMKPEDIEAMRQLHERHGMKDGGAADDQPVDRLKMSHKDVTQRVPELTEAAQKLGTDDMTPEMYQELVNRHKPVRPWEFVPEPATYEQIADAVRKNQKPAVGKGHLIPKGHPVGLRLDIPAYKDYGVWAPTIHDKSGDKSTVLAHEPVAHVSNAEFSIPENKALNVAKGTNKSPFATIDGNWEATHPEQIHAMAEAYLNHPEWSQVGMDPERHSYFYDRRTQEPITHADEVLQVGPLLLAKNARSNKAKNEFAFADGGDVGHIPHDDPQYAKNLAKFHGKTPDEIKGSRWYHGTGYNFQKFHDGPIFLSRNPKFASGFAQAEGAGSSKDDWDNPKFVKEVSDWVSHDPETRNPNVMPLHVKAENPFDYENPEHLKRVLRNIDFSDLLDHEIRSIKYHLPQGDWETIERDEVQDAIKNMGHDSFFVNEEGEKNLGVYDPSQIKSATGNNGNFDQSEEDITKRDGGDVEGYISQDDPRRAKNLKNFHGKTPDAIKNGKWLHGTDRDFQSFMKGPSGAIFVTQDPEFANKYAHSQLNEEQLQSSIDYARKMKTSEPMLNVMPVHVRAEKPFDFENRKHIAALYEELGPDLIMDPYLHKFMDEVREGHWGAIESSPIQNAIKAMGHDSFFVKENGVKNLGVYDPTQIKSATGNVGNFDRTDEDITKSDGGEIVQPSRQPRFKKRPDSSVVDKALMVLSKKA
jgi:hypothetical protein